MAESPSRRASGRSPHACAEGPLQLFDGGDCSFCHSLYNRANLTEPWSQRRIEMFRQPRTYQSWGRYPHAAPSRVTQVHWPDELRPVLAGLGPFLAYGKGRSYGDSCLNKDGHLLDVNGLDRITGFDSDTGMVECEAGVSLAELLEVFVPKGWFLPVTPGTKFVTVG